MSTTTGFPLLSWLVWLPIAGGVAVLALGEARAAAGRWLALAVSVAEASPPESSSPPCSR